MAYRVYRVGPDGVRLVPTQEAADDMGISGETLQLLLRGMTVVKEICLKIGQNSEPPFTWDRKMPDALIRFVTEKVTEGLKANPDYAASDFDYGLVYHEPNVRKFVRNT